ncbi:MAG TPA: toll/interleukin-1 receptor domain-containing protein [Actinophytocola sp.]|uniref:toll/interleukin-1 receptor domain-containing protein n=1 Tax=Actinophytocola sp. TaxID=1872138 RepID=UPI002DDC93C3|nr:toll/interleukin-1 receptor domain-containing protein [Actinophytocola sp.]HEV2781145.1 toll/interleukin-1 receptor domain-containing protein [Actinophytocola sp.]
MSGAGDVRPPRVFISHAGSDRPNAEEFARNLSQYRIGTFVDAYDIWPGENVVLRIHRELTQSDYFVLLWSQHCDGNAHVEQEFAAALARELTEVERRCAFVFIIRLDGSNPPGLLAPRRYLDASAGWGEVVAQLVRTWRDDRGIGLRVLPAPRRIDNGAGPRVVLYIRNRSLSVAHLLPVPGRCSGRELDGLVRTGLALPDSVAEFDGRTGIRFHYRLYFAGDLVPPDRTLAAAGIGHHSTIDLEVRLEFFGPNGPTENGTIVRGPDDPTPLLPPATIRTLVRKGFAHLTPRPQRS